eukprot:580816-Amphidinium_carterae.1
MASQVLWVCLDFEATCDEGLASKVHRDEAELIEFSYAVLDLMSSLHSLRRHMKGGCEGKDISRCSVRNE